MFRLIITLFAACLVSGCIEGEQEIGPKSSGKDSGSAVTTIAVKDILAEPEPFINKQVVVAGKVLPGLAFEFISEQPYQIIQGESLMWVITNDVAPQEGSFVTVRGRIAKPYQIKGRSYELVLIEEERLK